MVVVVQSDKGESVQPSWYNGTRYGFFLLCRYSPEGGTKVYGTDCIGYRCVKHRVCPAWMVHGCTDQTVQGYKIKDLYGLNWYIE